MPTVRLANYPKPIRNAPVVNYYCKRCGKKTGHYMFTTDANYFGPLILMPLSKLAPKHIHIICPHCLNMVELDREYGERLLAAPQKSSPQIDAIQDAISTCYQELANCQIKKGFFTPESVYKEQINQIMQAYFQTLTIIMDAYKEDRTKKCPFCKERIKYDAIKCRYCGSDLSGISPSEDSPSFGNVFEHKFSANDNPIKFDLEDPQLFGKFFGHKFSANDNPKKSDLDDEDSYVVVIVEKEKYAKAGVHKGMQGRLCFVDESNAWLVSFPQSDKKDDTVEILMDADDFEPLPNGMDARINEQIKAKFDKQV